MIAYLDCFSGVSGDKFLGALVDAGFSMERLHENLSGLEIGDHEIVVEWTTRGGVSAAHVSVETTAEQPPRTWRAIREMLDSSGLPARVKDGALRAFVILAEAEAKIHGVDAEDVHFHEVGAVDAIVDIVGVAAGLAALDIDELIVSPVATGSGMVETDHGTLPVPAPATVELLLGVPTYSGEVDSELTTPTGAALLRAFATSFGRMPIMTAVTTGYGAGDRELPIPNVLRLVLAEHAEPAPVAPLPAGAEAEPAPEPPALNGMRSEEIVLLETNIDHLTGEHLAYAAERLLAEGALDVWQTPIFMKKGRPAVTLSVLVTLEGRDRLAELTVELTGSLGVRVTPLTREVAPRWTATVETSLGSIRVKVARFGGVDRVRPEADDVARVARTTGLPFEVVARRIAAEAEGILGC